MLLRAAAVSPASAAAPAGSDADGVVGGHCAETDLDQALAMGGTTPALAAGASVTFDCGGPKTIAISTVKVITQDITLNGGDQITLSGGNSTRLFAVNSGVTFQLKHITLDLAASTGGDGGAIANHGNLVLDHATIQHSHTDLSHSGGAIFSDGPMTITDSSLLDNGAGSAGAAFT